MALSLGLILKSYPKLQEYEVKLKLEMFAPILQVDKY